MKILFLTNQLPFPPISGGKIKSWNLVDFFSNNHDLSVVSIINPDDIENLEEFRKKIKLKRLITKELNVKRSIINLLLSYFTRKTLNNFRTYSAEIKNNIKKIANDYDILFVDHYEMFQYVPRKFKGKVILHTHNAEYIMWERYANLEKSKLKKLFIKLEAKRIFDAEIKCCELADLVFAAPNDQTNLSKTGILSEKFRTTFHLGNDKMLDLPDYEFSNSEKALLCIGTLSWEPNVDGLVWFITDVWPTLISEHPDLKFYVVGKDPDKRIIEVSKEYSNIILTGFVDDTLEYYDRARVFIVPLRFGSGIKVKLLNTMYRGLPCVTTSIGTEGLEIENGKDLLIADDPGLFAKNVLQILTDEKLWNTLKQNSRKAVEDKYTWKKLLDSHNKDIINLLN